DASRFWYLPCDSADGAFVFKGFDGQPIDVDGILREHRAASTRSYGEAALRKACTAVGRAQNGMRNSLLNREAFGIGQLVAGGEVDELRAVDHHAAAGRAAGLSDGEIRRTLASGLSAGSRRHRFGLGITEGTRPCAGAVSLEVDKKGAPKKH